MVLSTLAHKGRERDNSRRPKWPFPTRHVQDILDRCPATEEELNTETSISLVYDFFKPHLEEPQLETRDHQTSRTRTETATKEERMRRALLKLRQNDFRGASREIGALPMARMNEEVMSTLKALYPSDERDIPDMSCPEPGDIGHMKVTPTEVKDILRSMKISAPGKSKVGLNHVKQLLRGHTRILRAFTNVVNVVILGLPGWDDPRLNRLTEARGIGLVKDVYTGKLRPIGINEVFVNILAKIVLGKLKGKIIQSLHPHDFGYGRQGGTENVIQAVNALFRKRIDSGENFILLQLDFENAFNGVFRKAIFDRIRQVCPELLPFARYRYRDLKVFFLDALDEFKIDSKAGVSQGCPCSPALFQMVMTQVLEEVRKMPEVVVLSYLDDVSLIFKSLTQAWEAFTKVQESAAKVGLRLNIKKSNLFWLNPSTTSMSEEETQAFQRFVTSGVQISREGAELLGGFVGTDEYVRRKVEEKFEEMKEVLKFFQELCEYAAKVHGEGKGFDRQRLLRFAHWCINPLPTYLLRVTSSQLTYQLTKDYDRELVECFFSLVKNIDLKPHPTFIDLQERHRERNPSLRSVISLGRIFCSRGGANFRSAEKTAHPAYLGSIALTAGTVHEVVTKQYPGTSFTDVDFAYLTRSGLAEVWIKFQAFNLVDPNMDTLREKYFPNFRPEEPRKGIQRALYQQFEETVAIKKLTTLSELYAKQDMEGKIYNRKYMGARFPYAQAWIWSPLGENSKYNLLRDEIVENELITSIGEHPYVPDNCAICKKQLITETKPTEDHGVSCCASNGAKSRTGGIVERAALNAIRLLDDTATIKPKLDSLPILQRILPKPMPAKEDGDILTTLSGRMVVIDVTFSARSGIDAKQLEQSKIKEYQENRYYSEKHFVPFAFTTSGEWGLKAVEFLGELSEIIRSMHRGPFSRIGTSKQHRNVLKRVRETISIGICKANWVYMEAIRYGYNSRTDIENTRVNINNNRGRSRIMSNLGGESGLMSSTI
jgi:hypothetical protein